MNEPRVFLATGEEIYKARVEMKAAILTPWLPGQARDQPGKAKASLPPVVPTLTDAKPRAVVQVGGESDEWRTCDLRDLLISVNPSCIGPKIEAELRARARATGYFPGREFRAARSAS